MEAVRIVYGPPRDIPTHRYMTVEDMRNAEIKARENAKRFKHIDGKWEAVYTGLANHYAAEIARITALNSTEE